MAPAIPNFVQTEDKAFVRDTKTSALLNTDRTALARARAARSRSSSIAAKVANLESELADLKSLVRSLLAK